MITVATKSLMLVGFATEMADRVPTALVRLTGPARLTNAAYAMAMVYPALTAMDWFTVKAQSMCAACAVGAYLTFVIVLCRLKTAW